MSSNLLLQVFLISVALLVTLTLVPPVRAQFGFGPESNYLYNPGQYQPPRTALGPAAPLAPVRAGFSVGNGSYTLEWEVEGGSITLKASRRGSGFVGFAISPTGGMSGADIFIAGVDIQGVPFANDYHHEYQPGGIGSAVPDQTNNYQVLGVYERDGKTTALFQRLLDTRDTVEDIPIQNTVQNILWSIGPPSRGLEYHGPANRGVVKINLLNPPAAFRQSAPLR